MHSSTLIITLLSTLALAAPQWGPLDGGLGGSIANPPPPATTPAPASATSSPSAPTSSVSIFTGGRIEEEDRKANEDPNNPLCHSGTECDPVCKKQLPNVGNLSSTCVMSAAPGQGVANTGRCACYDGSEIANLLVGFGEALCVAVNGAVNAVAQVGEAAALAVAPEALVPAEVGEGVAAAYRIGKTVVKKAGKNCQINACPGETYQVIDPSDPNGGGNSAC